MSEFESMEAENKRLKRQIKGYKGLLAARGVKTSESEYLEAPASASEPPASASKPASKRVHYVRPWEKECKDCGEPNDDYWPGKDYLACDKCKGGVASTLPDARALDYCPHCGSTGGVHWEKTK